MDDPKTVTIGDRRFAVDDEGYIAAPEGDDLGLYEELDTPQGVVEVLLPSGHVTYLEVPSLACLLRAGSSSYDLVSLIWRHPQGSIASLSAQGADISEDEIEYCYEWALSAFAKTPASLGLASVCKLYRVPPSVYVGGIKDRFTAYLFDAQVAETLAIEQNKETTKGGSKTALGPQEDLLDE